MEAEPTNKYDPNAIKVLSDDAENLFLGYIIARDRQSEDLFLAADIDDPDNYTAVVMSNGKSKDTIYLALERNEETAEAPSAA